MRLAVYFFKGLFEFIFGSFLPSEKCQQPINPVGPIESVECPEAKKDIIDERREALELLDRCLKAEYRVAYPVKGERDAN